MVVLRRARHQRLRIGVPHGHVHQLGAVQDLCKHSQSGYSQPTAGTHAARTRVARATGRARALAVGADSSAATQARHAASCHAAGPTHPHHGRHDWHPPRALFTARTPGAGATSGMHAQDSADPVMHAARARLLPIRRRQPTGRVYRDLLGRAVVDAPRLGCWRARRVSGGKRR